MPRYSKTFVYLCGANNKKEYGYVEQFSAF